MTGQCNLIVMSMSCPNDPDETAEASLMGILTDEECSQFVLHLTCCQACRRILALNLRYIPAMREAAKRCLSKQNAAKRKSVRVAGAAGR
jgi:hypothetical protein